jgi:hypothetical protein
VAAVIRIFRKFLARLRERFRRPFVRRIVHVGELYDVPETLDPATFYVAGSAAAPKWAAFLCPCGTGHQVILSLQRSHSPSWRLTVRAGKPTIWPSVDILDARRCHYWIQAGRVHWVRDRA